LSERTPMTEDLFEYQYAGGAVAVPLAPGAPVLWGFASVQASALVAGLAHVLESSPFRHMVTPGGFRMSVAMTNAGAFGWGSDRTGYRYADIDPETGRPWPPMPVAFRRLAMEAAARAGFPGFAPDACLINRCARGAKLSLHQDQDERALGAPIVSVSLGIPAVFLFGGLPRADRPRRVPFAHGDVVVCGGPARLRYHGVLPIEDADYPLLGRERINLSFRKTLGG
jgi:alkylated DNA repair protein (DNA oxidative demethylase)